VTGERVAGDEIRERDERDARFFAWDVPVDAHIVALVHEAEDAERSATVADAIATSVARRREHTLLLSADPGPSPLDELLGATSSPGLPAALDGRARLTDVAVQRPDRPFVYLPAGPDPVAMRTLLEEQLLATFIERVRERGGTLFIVLSEDALGIEPLCSLLDGYVALGNVSVPEAGRGLAQFGRVRFGEEVAETTAPAGNGASPPEPPEGASDDPPVDAPGDASLDDDADEAAADIEAAPADAAEAPADLAAGGEGASAWQRHRKAPAFPLRRVGAGVVAVLAVVLGWWALASRPGGDASARALRGGPDDAGAPPAPPVVPAAAAFDADAARAALEAAPELAFSVLMASFNAASDAAERVAELRDEGPGLFFVAPTPIRGVIYHRVFAGAVETRAEAQTLMDDLVASGRKDEAGAWHLRPSNLAFALGVYGDRTSAERRIAELADEGLPAYALTAPFGEGTAWRVYAGAYNSEPEAGPMAEMLRAAGEPAELTSRRGIVPPS